MTLHYHAISPCHVMPCHNATLAMSYTSSTLPPSCREFSILLISSTLPSSYYDSFFSSFVFSIQPSSYFECSFEIISLHVLELLSLHELNVLVPHLIIIICLIILGYDYCCVYIWFLVFDFLLTSYCFMAWIWRFLPSQFYVLAQLFAKLLIVHLFLVGDVLTLGLASFLCLLFFLIVAGHVCFSSQLEWY